MATPSAPSVTPKVDQGIRFRRVFTTEQGEMFLAQLEAVLAASEDESGRRSTRKTALLITCSNGHIESMTPRIDIAFPAPQKGDGD